MTKGGFFIVAHSLFINEPKLGDKIFLPSKYNETLGNGSFDNKSLKINEWDIDESGNTHIIDFEVLGDDSKSLNDDLDWGIESYEGEGEEEEVERVKEKTR